MTWPTSEALRSNEQRGERVGKGTDVREPVGQRACAVGDARRGGEALGRDDVGAGEQRPERRGERRVGAALVELVDRLAALRVVEPPDRRELEGVERVDHAVHGAPLAARRRAEDHVHRDEHEIDDRERRLEEVIDVTGDELPELVDEPAEPGTTEHGHEEPHARREDRHGGGHGDDHHEPAPDRVRDVEGSRRRAGGSR
ncbi:MAG TPA: hypothetical protein VI462_00220 [Acidimicrobiia bacterium]